MPPNNRMQGSAGGAVAVALCIRVGRSPAAPDAERYDRVQQWRAARSRDVHAPLALESYRQASIETVAHSEPLINFQAPCVSPPATTIRMSEGSKISNPNRPRAARRLQRL